jgi:hypothetical protein
MVTWMCDAATALVFDGALGEDPVPTEEWTAEPGASGESPSQPNVAKHTEIHRQERRSASIEPPVGRGHASKRAGGPGVKKM